MGVMVAADGGIRGYHRAIRRKWAVLGILVIITVFMCLLSVNAGAATMTPIEVLKTLLGISGDERSFVVIWRLRMPRVVAAIVAGMIVAIASMGRFAVLFTDEDSGFNWINEREKVYSFL